MSGATHTVEIRASISADAYEALKARALEKGLTPEEYLSELLTEKAEGLPLDHSQSNS